MRATIVAFYGPKPQQFRELLVRCQQTVQALFGTAFRPYDFDQIHATLIGLERVEATAVELQNLNFKILRGVEAAMDLDGLIAWLRRSLGRTIAIQMGGYQDRDYPFTSRGARPFNRSFFIHGGNVVLAGWPLDPPVPGPIDPSATNATGYPSDRGFLHQLRLHAQLYGVLHAYHRSAEDIDNDLYLRIGMIDDPHALDPAASGHAQNVVRQMLAALPPLVIDMDLASICVAFYEATELPPASTRTFALDDSRLTRALMRRNYSVGSSSHPD